MSIRILAMVACAWLILVATAANADDGSMRLTRADADGNQAHPDVYLLEDIRRIDTDGTNVVVRSSTGASPAYPIVEIRKITFPTLATASTPAPLTTADATGDDTVRFAAVQSPVIGTGLVQFDVMRSTTVRLELFDVAGRRALILNHAYLNAGTYTLHCAYASGGGLRMTPGMYFVVLTADRYHESRKVLLLGH